MAPKFIEVDGYEPGTLVAINLDNVTSITVGNTRPPGTHFNFIGTVEGQYSSESYDSVMNKITNIDG